MKSIALGLGRCRFAFPLHSLSGRDVVVGNLIWFGVAPSPCVIMLRFPSVWVLLLSPLSVCAATAPSVVVLSLWLAVVVGVVFVFRRFGCRSLSVCFLLLVSLLGALLSVAVRSPPPA